jgi:hypothetical protein
MMSKVTAVTNNPLTDLYSTASQAGLGVARKLLTSQHTWSADFGQQSRMQRGAPNWPWTSGIQITMR